MFYFSAFLFPLMIMLLAAGLLFWHVRSWRSEQQEHGAELDFARRKFRRRVQTTGMLALLAVGLCLGQLIPRNERPTLFVVFRFAMLLILAWMVLLALGDLTVSRQHLAHLNRERRIAEAQLKAELERLRGPAANKEQNC
jgi:hypothetical protein